MSVVTERKLLPSELRLVEQKLYDYRINKSLTKEYLAQREELERNIKQRKPRDPMTVQLLLLEEKARREQFWLEAIEDVMERLPEEDRRLIELKYLGTTLPNTEVAAELHISDSELYRRNQRILQRFAQRFGMI